MHGELLVLGVRVAASTVWEILHDAGIDPAPERSSTTWADFLRSQAEALLACDFFETVTLSGARLHALRESGQSCNGHRPHQGIANARPLQPLPVPLVVPDQIASLDIRRRDRLGGVLHEYQHSA